MSGAGRWRLEAARAAAHVIPDCVVLVRRLARDPRVPRRSKLLLVFLVAYLALPFDLIPDFIPVLGQLDDALLVVLVLRFVVRSAGPGVVRENWPGSDRALARITQGREPRSSAAEPNRDDHLE